MVMGVSSNPREHIVRLQKQHNIMEIIDELSQEMRVAKCEPLMTSYSLP